MQHKYLPPCLETYPSVPVVGAGEAGTVAVAGADIVAVAGVDIVAGAGVADIVVAGEGADTAVAVEEVADLKKNSDKSDIITKTLRLYKTAITWLRSLSAILPLFWRHATAELHRFCREDLRNVLWCHEICDVFPRNMTYILQNMQFSRYFTMKFNIFSLNLTGESDFFILFISTHIKLSMGGF